MKKTIALIIAIMLLSVGVFAESREPIYERSTSPDTSQQVETRESIDTAGQPIERTDTCVDLLVTWGVEDAATLCRTIRANPSGCRQELRSAGIESYERLCLNIVGDSAPQITDDVPQRDVRPTPIRAVDQTGMQRCIFILESQGMQQANVACERIRGQPQRCRELLRSSNIEQYTRSCQAIIDAFGMQQVMEQIDQHVTPEHQTLVRERVEQLQQRQQFDEQDNLRPQGDLRSREFVDQQVRHQVRDTAHQQRDEFAVYRDQFVATRQQLAQCTHECESVEQDVLQRHQAMVNQAIEITLRQLRFTADQLEQSAFIDQITAQEQIALIHSDIRQLEEYATQLTQASSRQQINEISKLVRGVQAQAVVNNGVSNGLIMHGRLKALLIRMDTLQQRLEQFVDNQSDQTEQLEMYVQRFSTLIDDARIHVQQGETHILMAYGLSNQSGQQLQQELRQAQHYFQLSNQQIRDAHQVLVQIIQMR